MVKLLRQETDKNRSSVSNWDDQIKKASARLSNIETLLALPPISQDDLQDISDQTAVLSDLIQELEEKAKQLNQTSKDPQNSTLDIYKQQAELGSKKKNAAQQQLREVQDCEATKTESLALKKAEYEQLAGHKFMDKEELAHYADGLRNKTVLYQQYKCDLSEIRGDGAILARTVEILRRENEAQESKVEETEECTGVSGYQETEKGLQALVIKKAQIDQAKETSLDSISQLVLEIRSRIQERRHQLAPHIAQLTDAKKKLQEIEAIHAEKKSKYDAICFEVDSALADLRNDEKALQAEVDENLIAGRKLELDARTVKALLKRAEKERIAVSNNNNNSEHLTISMAFDKKIFSLEHDSCDLRKQQKKMEETRQPRMLQRQKFSTLHILLDKKLKSVQELANRNIHDNNLKMEVGGFSQRLIVAED